MNFYYWFICNFLKHAHPLFDLTKKDVEWQWEEDKQRSFKMLKEAIVSSPVLVFPNNSWPFWIEADSSNFATGAVLSQETADGL